MESFSADLIVLMDKGHPNAMYMIVCCKQNYNGLCTHDVLTTLFFVTNSSTCGQFY